MGHSYYDIYIHVIWTTKYRENMIDVDIEKTIFNVVKEKCTKFKCEFHAGGNTENHIHILISISPETNLHELIKEIKGSTSYNVNHNLDKNLYWQNGYGALSVSKSNLNTIKEYVQNQKEHHATKNSINTLLEKYE